MLNYIHYIEMAEHTIVVTNFTTKFYWWKKDLPFCWKAKKNSVFCFYLAVSIKQSHPHMCFPSAFSSIPLFTCVFWFWGTVTVDARGSHRPNYARSTGNSIRFPGNKINNKGYNKNNSSKGKIRTPSLPAQSNS